MNNHVIHLDSDDTLYYNIQWVESVRYRYDLYTIDLIDIDHECLRFISDTLKSYMKYHF
jgi:hypothetical protein